jgi:hypothetical protein
MGSPCWHFGANKCTSLRCTRGKGALCSAAKSAPEPELVEDPVKIPRLADQDGDAIKTGVFSVTPVDDPERPKSQVAEVEVASHKDFKRLKKSAQGFGKSKTLSGAMTLVMFSIAALGVGAFGTEPVEEVQMGAAAAAIAAVVSCAKTLGFGLAVAAEQYATVTPKSGMLLGVEVPTQDWKSALEMRSDKVDSLNQSPITSFKNPFLPPTAEIYAELGKTQDDIAMGIRNLIDEDFELFKTMPHKSQIRRAENEKMSIKLKPGMENEVPRCRRTKTPVHLQPILRDALVQLLNVGFIKPSTSPFSAPCMLISKPHQEGVAAEDLEYRMVVDLRDLNRITVPMHHRIPNIEGIWHTVSKAKYVSVLDLSKGFHQESLRENDADEPGNGGTSSSDKTAFSTEFGHFQFVGCVMGATNTPAFFQSKVEMALRRDGLIDLGLLKSDSTKLQPDRDGNIPANATPIPVYDIKNARPCCTPFIDDIIVYSETKEQHLADLRRVFECLSKNQYYVNKKKCHFGCKYALFCGGIVGNGILAMDPIKIKAICDWEQPTDVTTLRSFLGLANYLKGWYKNYSDQAGILTNLLKKGQCVRKDWGPEHTAAFCALKDGFKQYPILRLPDFSKQFYLVTDSCKHAIGGAVCQMYEFEGKKSLMPVAYHSRKMTKHEVNYSVREQEGLAIYDCFRKFEYLLLGSPFEVIMETDHSSLKQIELGASLQSSKRLIRWAEYMGGFAYKIVWIPGKTNLIGDGISRSLSADEGTMPISGANMNVPQISGITSYVDDSRLDQMDYSKSTEFKSVFDLLGSDMLVDQYTHPETRYFERHDERLYYRRPNGRLVLCIPSELRVEVEGVAGKIPLREALLMECHDSVYMGHRGVNKTYAQVSQIFYWRRLRKDVAKYVSSCKTCMKAKASTRGEMGVLKAKECPKGPMNSVTIDFITGMPATTTLDFPGRKITQAAVLVDRFCKKVFIFPLPETATAEEVSHAVYKKVFREHGWPLELISDRDTKFTSRFWQELFRVVGTKLSMSYAYHRGLTVRLKS